MLSTSFIIIASFILVDPPRDLLRIDDTSLMLTSKASTVCFN